MLLDPNVIHRLPASSSPNPARCWAGVDGGGTSTRVVLADAQGRVVGRGSAGPSALGQGGEQSWRSIQLALTEAAAQAGWADSFSLTDCALGLGLSGLSLEAQRRDFLALSPAVADLALVSDGVAAVLGAHGGRPGAIVISGTGSVGDAIAANGQHREVGGWGWSLGDEGSGAWLGRRAMQHAQAALDGRENAGTLAQAVWALAGQQRTPILSWCAQAGQAGFASLAPLVFEHEAADPVAAGLLAQAASELERIAAALDPAAELPLCLSGSIALRLADRLAPHWRERLVSAQGDAAEGALLLIRHLHPPR